MQPLKTELVPASLFVMRMNSYGGVFIRDRSNALRHVYFSRRLNRWFGVSSEAGGVRINQYTDCPCAMST